MAKKQIVPNKKAQSEPEEIELNVRDEAIAYHEQNTSSKHNPYHPSNGAVAKCLREIIKPVRMYDVSDVNKWSNHHRNVNLIISLRVKRINLLYEDGEKTVHTFALNMG